MLRYFLGDHSCSLLPPPSISTCTGYVCLAPPGVGAQSAWLLPELGPLAQVICLFAGANGATQTGEPERFHFFHGYRHTLWVLA